MATETVHYVRVTITSARLGSIHCARMEEGIANVFISAWTEIIDGAFRITVEEVR